MHNGGIMVIILIAKVQIPAKVVYIHFALISLGKA